MYSPKNPGYPAFVSWPLRPCNPGMTRCTLGSYSYRDTELVKVKTVIGHVTPGLQGLELRFNSAAMLPMKALGF